MLTQQQVHAFNKDLSDLMRKYGLRGIAGICIDKTGDGGIIDLHDGLSPCKEAIMYFADLLQQKSREMGAINGGQVRGVNVPDQRQS